MVDQSRVLKAELDEKEVHIKGLRAIPSGTFLPRMCSQEETNPNSGLSQGLQNNWPIVFKCLSQESLGKPEALIQTE